MNILIGITGGIASYKIPFLIRLLRQRGDNVRVVLTEHASAFISPLTLQALTDYPVRQALFDPEAEQAMSHIELARWADVYLIAPATANTLAKLANGLADNLLTTLYLATRAPVIIAPAMNTVMLEHPTTQNHLKILAERDIVLKSASGQLACGEVGAGRLPEPEILLNAIDNTIYPKDLKGQRWLLTVGATRERIDPVRFISNDSSGKMGFALAQEALLRGAEVTVVAGLTTAPEPLGLNVIRVESALQMFDAVRSLDCDVFIGVAAVADYRIKNPLPQKHKKNNGALTLDLVENPDIIQMVANRNNRPYVVGFSAESEALLNHARAKLERKKLDLIIANDVRQGVFGSDDNQVYLLTAKAEQALPQNKKTQIAKQIIDFIVAERSASKFN